MYETGQDIMTGYNRLKGTRGNYETLWQDVADDVLGMREFTGTINPGENRTRTIYDTTGMAAGYLLSNTFNSLLTNPGARWSQAIVPRGFRELGENGEYLAHVDEVMDDLFKRPEFGFPTASTESYLDYVFFGTLGMFTADIPGVGPLFQSRPLGELVVDEGADGRVDTVFRDFKLTIRQFIEEYGREADREITQQLTEFPNRIIEMVHLIHPRREIRSGKEQTGRPFRSAEVVKRTQAIVRSGGSATAPWAVARWMKDAGELYGRGPGIQALGDCQSASEYSRLMMEAGQQHVQPALLVPSDGVLTQVDSSPHALVVYNANMMEPGAITKLPQGDASNLSIEVLRDHRDQIQQRFYSHLLQLFDQSGQTATASLEMETKASRILVSVISRASAEFCQPLIARAFDVANRNGMFDAPPDTLEGVPIGIRYLSPIMKAQRQEETKATLNTMAAAAQIAAATGQTAIYDVFDFDKEIRQIALNEGMEMGNLRSQDAIDVLREFRAEQEQQAQQMEQASQEAEMIGKAGPTLVKMNEQEQAAS